MKNEIVKKEVNDIANLEEQFDLLAKFKLPPAAAQGCYVIKKPDGKLVLRNRARRINIWETDEGLCSSANASIRSLSERIGLGEIKTRNRSVVDNVLCCSIEPKELMS